MKRVAAWLFDAILICVLATGAAWLLAGALGYDTAQLALDEAYARYEQEYGITFNMSAEAFEAMTPQQRENYDAAYEALISDGPAMHSYQMVMNLTLLITTLGILIAMLILEFAVPLAFGNGQTVGKKIFSLGVVRQDCVKMNTMQLFTRTLLGKYTLETMIPVYLLLMIFWGILGLTGTLILAALLIVQLVLLCATKNHVQLHDLLAGTVVVDVSSQMIFRDTEHLIEYTKRIHAERAERQPY